MKLNTTSQHAIRIMVFIAKQKQKLHHAKEISEKLNIPYKYLTKIMAQLVEAKIINSIRGREGGYTIEKNTANIKINDILAAVNESLSSTECLLGTRECDEDKKCAMHDRWKTPRKSMLKMFHDTTLEDISKE